MKLGQRFCEDCDGVTAETRDKHPSQRLCGFWPTTENIGFVDRTYHASAPFKRCRDINTDGCCPIFKHRPDGQMEMGT